MGEENEQNKLKIINAGTVNIYPKPPEEPPKALPKCWVCGKDKKPYTVFMDDNVMSYLAYEQAREKGPICERCWKFYCITDEFKEATDEEFTLAIAGNAFAQLMLVWWEKDGKMDCDKEETLTRGWDGTHSIREWAREFFKTHEGQHWLNQIKKGDF